MATTYVYAYAEYSTLADAQSAVLVLKNKLDTCPTNWVVVKQVEPSGTDDGWVIPPTVLTDAAINNLDGTKQYSVHSIFSGENLLGLPATKAAEKVSHFRSLYANRMRAHVILEVDESSTREVPTDIDMSGYV